jgi:hypothetical protein
MVGAIVETLKGFPSLDTPGHCLLEYPSIHHMGPLTLKTNSIFVTNASKHANRASMVLGWFGADLVVNPPLVIPFPF